MLILSVSCLAAVHQTAPFNFTLPQPIQKGLWGIGGTSLIVAGACCFGANDMKSFAKLMGLAYFGALSTVTVEDYINGKNIDWKRASTLVLCANSLGENGVINSNVPSPFRTETEQKPS
jgi:hypothetical protein